ncbi:hypothetical protein KY284_030612 [Solanum tuberosum]|nr:hypothetical protein KY284_030612 [Solanum tuberosum]
MGSLACLTDVRADRVETNTPKLIEQTIKKALVPLVERMVKCEGTIKSHNVRLNDLTARLEAWEMVECISGALDTMRDELATLRVEVVLLQSTYISMLWGDVPLLDTPVPMSET